MGAWLHELWDEGDNGQTLRLAGPRGDAARGLLGPNARLVWTVEAPSHFEAMTLYYEHMGWGAVLDRASRSRPADLRRARLGSRRRTEAMGRYPP